MVTLTKGGGGRGFVVWVMEDACRSVRWRDGRGGLGGGEEEEEEEEGVRVSGGPRETLPPIGRRRGGGWVFSFR